MSHAQIASTILAQLGGNRFRVMTGASSFVSGIMRDGQPGLSFRLPRCKSGITSCIITLTPADLYDIQFGRMANFDFQVVEQLVGVSVENLTQSFEKTTGLFVKL